MRNPGPDDILSDTEIENLRRFETAAQRGLLLVIEEELAALKLLLAYVDWDAEFRGLFGEENPPGEPGDAPEGVTPSADGTAVNSRQRASRAPDPR